MNFDESEPIFRNSPSPIIPTTPPSPESDSETKTPSPRLRAKEHNPARLDPGNVILLQNLGPSVLLPTSLSESPSDSAIEECMESAPQEETTKITKMGCPPNVERRAAGEDNIDLAAAAVAAHTSEAKEVTSRSRVDSAQDNADPVTLERQKSKPDNIKIHTAAELGSQFPPPPNTISPTLQRHAIQPAVDTTNTLPAVQPTSPAQVATSGSPPMERLPSIRQLTGQLSELADAAVNQAPGFSHHQHTHSFGSATSQSPRHPYGSTFGGPIQPPPTGHYGYGGARSPTSIASESQAYGSPSQYSPNGYYADRRTSGNLENPAPLAFPASLPSASSSGDSHGQTSSGTDSTSQTTPSDHPQPLADGSQQRPILPPPAGMPSGMVLNTGFKCDEPGCTAPPFQTQYLLTSHKNVHSQERPHYCPIRGCARAEGGRGFKRKNEMIRHGLVHNSPGYICPFCPDREHRYPRPDNLQRHVRVHHPNRDANDPELRDVLAQRTEGAGRNRRRRTNTLSSNPDAVQSSLEACPGSGPLSLD